MKKTIISVEGLHNQLNNPNLIILDCSLEEKKSIVDKSFLNKCIKGARYFDLEGVFSDKSTPLPNTLVSPLTFQIEARRLGINESSFIVVYDNLGIYSSPRVWWMLKSMGHDNVYVLDGGLPEWIKQGFETDEIFVSDFLPGNFIAKFDASKFKNSEDIIHNIQSKESYLIDARTEGRFKGTAPEPRKELKSGSIPGSCNLPFQEVIKDGKMLAKNELEKVFEKLNLDKKPLTFTCGSGLTACIILLASEMILDNHKSVYDGSWTEWAEINGLKV